MSPIPSQRIGLVMKKGSPYAQFFTHVQQKIIEGGQWNHMLESWKQKSKMQKHYCSHLTATSDKGYIFAKLL